MLISTGRCLAVAILSALVVRVEAAPIPATVPDVGAFLTGRSYRSIALSTDDKRFLYQLSEESANVVSLAQTASRSDVAKFSTQLHDEPLGFWENSALLVSSDSGGDERTGLYAIGPDGRRQLIAGSAGARTQFVGWSRDHTRIFFKSNERSGSVFDLYAMESATLKRRLLYEGNHQWLVPSLTDGRAPVSEDERYVVLEQVNASNDVRVLLWDRTRRTAKAILGEGKEEKGITHALALSTKGDFLYALSNVGSQFLRLERIELDTGHTKVLADTGGEIIWASVSADESTCIVATLKDAATELAAVPCAGGALRKLPGLIAQSVFSAPLLDHAGRFVIVSATSDNRRPYLICYDLVGQKVLWSLGESPESQPALNSRWLVFRSFDGREIRGLLYTSNVSAAPRGVMIWAHGGPGGFTFRTYTPLFSYLASLGIAVYSVDYRGSGGYGSEFADLDNHAYGGGDVKDLIAAEGALTSSAIASGECIAIAGGSLGGYLTLMALTHQDARFVAGVDLFGIVDWASTLGAIPPWLTERINYFKSEIGDPADQAYLRSISPIYAAGRINTPLLVIHGENDPRVKLSESQKLVTLLHANDRPVQLVVMHNEGHGWPQSADNERLMLTAVADFLTNRFGEGERCARK